MFGWNLKRSAWLSKISELDERSLSNPINPLYLPRQYQYRFFHPLHNRLDKAHTLPDQLQHSDNSHQESKCHWISTDLKEKQLNKIVLQKKKLKRWSTDKEKEKKGRDGERLRPIELMPIFGIVHTSDILALRHNNIMTLSLMSVGKQCGRVVQDAGVEIRRSHPRCHQRDLFLGTTEFKS